MGKLAGIVPLTQAESPTLLRGRSVALPMPGSVSKKYSALSMTVATVAPLEADSTDTTWLVAVLQLPEASRTRTYSV